METLLGIAIIVAVVAGLAALVGVVVWILIPIGAAGLLTLATVELLRHWKIAQIGHFTAGFWFVFALYLFGLAAMMSSNKSKD